MADATTQPDQPPSLNLEVLAGASPPVTVPVLLRALASYLEVTGESEKFTKILMTTIRSSKSHDGGGVEERVGPGGRSLDDGGVEERVGPGGK